MSARPESLSQDRPAGSRRAALALAVLCGLLPMVAKAQPPSSPVASAKEKFADAKPGDLRVFATGAVQAPLKAVKAQAEQATGAPLALEFGPASGDLRTAILAGTAFDVAILTPEVDAELVRAGKLAPKTYEIGQVPIGMGVKGDATTRLDISTREGVERALLGAKAVRFSPQSMGGLTAQKIIADLGLEGRIHEDHGAADPDLLPGEYEIFINPLSEILAMKSQSVKSLGPIVASLQAPPIIAAAVSTSVRDRAAADRLIAFLGGPTMASALQASGLQPAAAH